VNLHKPVIEDGPHNLTVLVGDTAMFRCRAFSDLETHVLWWRVYHNVENDTFREEEIKVRMHGLHCEWFFFACLNGLKKTCAH